MILRIVALFAIGLMILGLIYGLLSAVPYSFPGPPTLSVDQITHPASSKTGLALMSDGIIFFALFPSVRVLLGINKFIHNHEAVNLIVAILVLLELAAGLLMFFRIRGVMT